MKPLLKQAKPLRPSLLRDAPAIDDCPPISTDFFGVDPLLERLHRYGHADSIFFGPRFPCCCVSPPHVLWKAQSKPLVKEGGRDRYRNVPF